MYDLQKVKLIIWDLDETFWNGTLSDGNMEINPKNIELIKNTTDSGVINSICSKNDEKTVCEVLEKNGILDLFVFRSINWTPKGDRVKQIIAEMQLREPNVLFIDDNALNIEEVRSACPNIMTCMPENLKDLYKFYREKEKKDLGHDRLKQYKILETKREFKAQVGTNEEFLSQSNIQVTIKNDCCNHIDRITDLINRSNQLNFTKIRLNEKEIADLVSDSNIKCGYVEVVDRFGDYGIVGFYAIKGNKLEHFVFSCRTLNMGVEQYVYNTIGRPELQIVGEVASNPKSGNPYWVNNGNAKNKSEKANLVDKILIKGPCDMSQMFSFINPSKNILTEFVYVNDKGVSIEQRNHTAHIIQSKTLNEQQKLSVINELPFGDKLMYQTDMFNDDIKVVVYSLFTDPNLGLYKRKSDGIVVAFGEYTNDLTDESKWNQYINKELFVANCNFNKENLKFIQSNYDFIGRLSPQDVFNNIKKIADLIDEKKLILVLGSETEFVNNKQEAYNDRHLYNKELNALIRNLAETRPNIQLLDVNKFINCQEDFTNNINHFNKNIYFKMSQELIALINNESDAIKISKINIGGHIKNFFNRVIGKIKKVFRRLHKSE